MKSAILIALAAIIIVAFSCSNERGGFLSNLLRGEASGIPVTVETVSTEDKANISQIPATLLASEKADISLPEDAVIESFAVAEGQAVNAGEVIARISEEEFAVRLARIRADLREIRNKAEKDGYILRNRDRLLDEGRIDQEQYDAIEKEVADDEAEIERIQADIGRAETNIGEPGITSPISGVLVKKLVTAGSMATAGNPIATVKRMDPALLEFRIGQEMAGDIKAGSRLNVVFPPLGDRREQATVTAIDTKIDPSDNKLIVRASIPNPAAIYKEGMTAAVEITGDTTRRVHLVPESSIIRDTRGYFVFTVVNGKAHRVQVIPEQTRGNLVEIARGLADDDMVVVSGHDRIKEGTAVDIWGR